jgi:acetyltransferase-like isoleucine patch superfamily enzyme
MRLIARCGAFLLRGVDRFVRLANELRARNRGEIAETARIYPSFRICNNGGRASISIGERSVLLCKMETLAHGGRIVVGSDCFIGENSYIWSAAEISIGDRVLISHGVNIHDHIAHSLSAAERHVHFQQIFSAGHPEVLENVARQRVAIEDDAWIGFNATILKGVTIGRGAIVGACSVVTKDVPPFAIVVGNPARQIGTAKP